MLVLGVREGHGAFSGRLPASMRRALVSSRQAVQGVVVMRDERDVFHAHDPDAHGLADGLPSSPHAQEVVAAPTPHRAQA
jgi:hypothetical protein